LDLDEEHIPSKVRPYLWFCLLVFDFGELEGAPELSDGFLEQQAFHLGRTL